MKKLKVCNLYCGIGGNRKLWQDVDVTAVELDPKIAAIYQDYFPDDKVIVGDAHQYLLDHYKEYDFIWSSPPCPTHSKIMKNFAEARIESQRRKPKYFDMRLYQEIILLDNFFSGKYCIENVKPYYQPLIKAVEIDRHLYWSNFILSFKKQEKSDKILRGRTKELQKISGFDLTKYNGINKTLAMRNCVHSETGLYILNCARNIITKSNVNQAELFDK